MTKKVLRTIVIFRNIATVGALLIIVCIGQARGQSVPANIDSTSKNVDSSAKEASVESEKTSKSVAAKSNIKVVFDETAPGVLIIESNGEKIRVDTTKKTVEQITVASETQEKPLETTKQTETAKQETQDKQDESVYDFDEGEEPYNYRLINIPTPKKVPKGTWNLDFTHRFSQPIHPLSESGRTLLGFDSFSVSSFAVTYGITDKLYVTANRSPLCQRGLCRTIEIGFGYNWIAQDKDTPFALTTYASVEGNGNFTEEYNYNLQAMISSRLGKRVYLFFSPAVHLNANGSNRFNPRAQDFFPPATAAVNAFHLPRNAASFGFGASVLIRHNLLALFDFTPRIGFKLGQVQPIFGSNFNVVGFENNSHPSIGFGIQRNIGKHAFALTFSNTQTTTTSRYNSSNLVLSPRRLIIGFNLFRRF
ncbi:MAG TPA: DUF5777 family beta-barrel protein [Pyrinomonadaceae bacterium]|jgi:hypothetical protein